MKIGSMRNSVRNDCSDNENECRLTASQTRNPKKIRLFCTTAISVALGTISLAHAQTAPSPAQAGSNAQVAQNSVQSASGSAQAQPEEIVVTSSRRAEKVKNVPSAITVLSGDTLTNLGVESLHDYAQLTPGLSFRDFGNPGNGTIIIRGLNSGSQQTTNTAAIYIDDAPFSASGYLTASANLAADPDIADLDRIEVLKGPQGTLYGANSLGGLIQFVSKQPNLNDFSGLVTEGTTAIDGGAAGYTFRNTVNIPVVPGTLAVRINGVYKDDPGWTDNVATGKNDANSSIVEGGRISALWEATDQLKVNASYIYQDIQNHGYAQQDNVTDTLTPLYGANKYASAFNLPSTIEYSLLQGKAQYDLENFSFIDSMSYGAYHTNIQADYTPEYLAYFRSAGPPFSTVIPANGAIIDQSNPNMNKFTNEARVVSQRLGPVEFVAGVFYTNEKNQYLSVLNVAHANGTPLAAPYNILYRATSTSNYDEVAGFGDITYYITDDLDLTGGVRISQNDQYAQTGGVNAVRFYGPRTPLDFLFSQTVGTYLLTLRYRPTEDISTYFRVATGYRPGGPQNNPSPPPGAQKVINSDTTIDYEAGVKATLFDGLVSADVSGYRIDWSDIQLPTLYQGLVLQGNAGDAVVNGFEGEFTYHPTGSLNIGLSIGYTDAHLTTVSPGAQTTTGVAPGDPLPLTPNWTLALLADQIVPITDNLTADFGATLSYRSDMPSSFPGTTLNPNVQIPSLTTLDLRSELNFEDKYKVNFRIENVTNSFGYTTIVTNKVYAGQPIPTNGFVIRPRTFVISFSEAF
jgi:iron complex outermembrane recepter protein